MKQRSVVDASPDLTSLAIPTERSPVTRRPSRASYIYINKDAIEEQVMTVSETSILAGSDVALDSNTRTNEQNGEVTPAPADATAAEIATMSAEEAPVRELR
jgi:hypothetical protein